MILGKEGKYEIKPPFFRETPIFGNPCLGPLTLNIRHCVQPCFNLGQILNQAKVGGPQKACLAESRCNFLIFVSKIKCFLKKKMDQDSIHGFLSKHENFAAHFNPFHGTPMCRAHSFTQITKL